VTGVGWSTARRWKSTVLISDITPEPCCPRCDPAADDLARLAPYPYLLGQYLGDGHLVTNTRVPVLRISTCTDYPNIICETRESIRSVRGREPGQVRFPTARLINVQSYWNHWPCLLPQHGAGRKHARKILLYDWQLDIVRTYPWQLLRGLIHSDGCRSLNTIKHSSRHYHYPRYTFNNESLDIIGIFTDALDLVGVRWRMCRPNMVSVARRPDVALMDDHIGPKT
jgi:hypothetical protein